MKRGRYFILLIILMLGLTVSGQERFRSGIFLHHSTGANIWGPNGSSTSIPDEIVKYNSDHSYDGEEECSLNEEWFPSNHGNEWADWHHLFDGDYPDDDIWPFIASNKIVVIKSCFPSSQVTGWGQPSDTNNFTPKSVYNYKWHWRHIIRIMESHPENFFMIWTNAPLVAASTNDDQAYWSHVFCTWAKDTLAKGIDPEYGEFPKNVYVFDFFHKLVGNDHKLKPEYAVSSTNSHPNSAATELVAPQFVKELFNASIIYENYYNRTLQPPALSSPANGVTDVAPDTALQWKTVEDVTEYHIQVSVSSGFEELLVDEVLEDTVFTFSTELSGETKYYWRVSSKKDEKESDWSPVWSFTTSAVTGRGSEVFIDGFKVFPNPAEGPVQISFGKNMQKVTLWVYDAYGRTVHKYCLGDGKIFHVDLTDLAPGYYFLRPDKGKWGKGKKVVIR